MTATAIRLTAKAENSFGTATLIFASAAAPLLSSNGFHVLLAGQQKRCDRRRHPAYDLSNLFFGNDPGTTGHPRYKPERGGPMPDRKLRLGVVQASAPTGAAAVDEGGNVLLTGVSNGVVDYGGGPLLPKGSNDITVVKLAP